MGETMSAVNETMSMVDGVKHFVGNVSDCGLNATEEGNCTNATMPADGEMIAEKVTTEGESSWTSQMLLVRLPMLLVRYLMLLVRYLMLLVRLPMPLPAL